MLGLKNEYSGFRSGGFGARKGMTNADWPEFFV